MSATEVAKELANIHHFTRTIMQSVCHPNFAKSFFPICPGYYSRPMPGKTEDTGYTKFWGVNMVHCSLCENGELLVILDDIYLLHNSTRAFCVWVKALIQHLSTELTYNIQQYPRDITLLPHGISLISSSYLYWSILCMGKGTNTTLK